MVPKYSIYRQGREGSRVWVLGRAKGPRESSVGPVPGLAQTGASRPWEVPIRGKGLRGRKLNHYPDSHHYENHCEPGRGTALLILFLPERSTHSGALGVIGPSPQGPRGSGHPGHPRGEIRTGLQCCCPLAMAQAEPSSPLPAPSPCPTVSHIQVVDEGLVGTLVHCAGLGELYHVQILGFPELRELAPGS